MLPVEMDRTTQYRKERRPCLEEVGVTKKGKGSGTREVYEQWKIKGE